jgi:hypothetical protein
MGFFAGPATCCTSARTATQAVLDAEISARPGRSPEIFSPRDPEAAVLGRARPLAANVTLRLRAFGGDAIDNAGPSLSLTRLQSVGMDKLPAALY